MLSDKKKNPFDSIRARTEDMLFGRAPREAAYSLLTEALSEIGVDVLEVTKPREGSPVRSVQAVMSSLYDNYVDQALKNCSEPTTIKALCKLGYQLRLETVTRHDGEHLDGTPYAYDDQLYWVDVVWPEDGESHAVGPYETKVEALAAAIAHARACISPEIIWGAYLGNFA